jgi:hypothetical protein
MKGSLRRNINLFYYNIFRFERFTQYLISYPINGGITLIGLGDRIAKQSGKDNWDGYILGVLNDPKGGISLIYARMQVTAHLTVLFLSLLNFLCGLLRLGLHTYWIFGGIVAAVLAFILSFYMAPEAHGKYLNDFKTFESMKKAQKRKSALATFLIIVLIWSTFVGSSIYYLASITR